MESYFKARKSFSSSSHPYNLGTILGLSRGHDDNHFLLKIYSINEQEFSTYYNYHLSHSLDNSLIDAKGFFSHVWQIIQDRIIHFKKQNPFDNRHGRHKENIEKLQRFQVFLSSIDEWNARSSDVVISEKEQIIQEQNLQIEKLQSKLSELNEHEVAQKIWINEGHLPTVIDLIQQMRELNVSSTRKLLKSDHKIPYAKMLSKYFSHAGKDIPLETARNYFVAKKDDTAVKGTSVPADLRLFKIISIQAVADK